MWQDILVSFVALGAVAILGWRWIRPKKATTPGCANCDVAGEQKR